MRSASGGRGTLSAAVETLPPWPHRRGRLAGVILTSARGVRQDISELRGEVGTLRERMAHLGGLMEGLREAITLRARAS